MKSLVGGTFCLLMICVSVSTIAQESERSVTFGNLKIGNSEREFRTAIYTVQCVELLKSQKRIAWVAFPSKTSIGVVSRICDRAQTAPLFRDEPNDRLREGWFVFSPEKSTAKRLRFSGLTDYSNPNFCSDLIAYWNIDSKYEVKSGRVALLRSGRTIKDHQLLTSYSLHTDDQWHLEQPQFQEKCRSVSFEEPGGHKYSISLVGG
jgi:hypothetical protein